MDGNNAFLGAAAVPAGEPSDIASHNGLERADGAECATTGIQEATPVPITPADEAVAEYKCKTQFDSDERAINVGLPNQVPRFKPGSVIKYISYYSGWPGGQGQLISDTMWAAATDWNSRNPGVKFQWTISRAEAAFEVVYGGAHATAVASAFFPNEPRGAQPRQLLVYEKTFTPSGLARMRNSFQHELGHIKNHADLDLPPEVMGLRHEHANASNEPTPAILVGVKNPLSIMGYLFQRSIQATDIEWLKYFYTLANGTVLRSENNTWSWPIRDYNP